MHTSTVIAILVTVAVAVALLVRSLKVPYTVALVIAGSRSAQPTSFRRRG
jgi:hypothetical protein